MSDPVPPNVQTPPLVSAAVSFPGISGVLAGRFHIEQRLGAGGMGEVYRARDASLRRLVAIKRMQHSASEADRKRFLHEGQRASALNHPGIAAIYDVFEEKGEVYLVMEYIEGETLRSRLARPIAESEFLRIATEAASALAAAHDKGILHRDIKPENIMLTGPASTNPGQVKLLDFGLAQQATDDSGTMETATALTMAGMFMGTPQYMAPEVLNGDPATRRSDLFALGVVFYEMLSQGRHPFAGPTPTAVIGQVLHQPPRPLAPTVPTRFASVVNKALAKNPADRYPDAHQIVRDLHDPALQPFVTTAVANTSTIPATATPERSRRDLLAIPAAVALGVLILVAVVAAGYSVLRHQRTPASNGTAAPAVAAAPGILAVLPPHITDAHDTQLASFGRGLADSLAQRLSELSVNHDIAVLTARQLEDKKVTTLADAARELGATTGLSIVLTRDGDLVHAAWKLGLANDGRVLGAGTITAPATDMFAVEMQLATAATGALNIHLRESEQRALTAHGTTFPEAYQYYLQGRGYLLQAFTPEVFKSAQTMFKEALRIDPNYGAAKAGIGEADLTAFDSTKDPRLLGDARANCNAAVDLGNAGAAGHMCLGNLADHTNRPADAASEYQKALELEPTNDRAMIGLAKAYEKLNLPEKAEAVYKQAITLRPDYWRGYDQLAGFYFNAGDYAKAEAYYRTATEKDPQSFRSFNNLAATLSAQNKDQEMVGALRHSIAIHPTSDSYYNLGAALLKLRSYKDSADAFRQAIRLAPEDYRNWSGLGDAEYFGGQRAQSANEYRKGIELASAHLKETPNDPDLLADVAGMYSMVGQSERAIELMNRALTINHTDSALMFNAALLYNQLQQTGPALEWLDKALQAGYPRSIVVNAAGLDSLHSNSRYQQIVQSPQPKP